MKAAIKYLNSQVNWLDDPDAGVYLEDRVDELRAAVEAIDEFRKSLPRFEDDAAGKLADIGMENRQTEGQRADARRTARSIAVNPLALHATRMLMEHFHFIERIGGQVRTNERHIALVIAQATRIEKLQSELNLMCTRTIGKDADEIRRDLRTMDKAIDALGIRASLRRVELAHNYMPGFTNEMPRHLRRVPMGGQWAKDKYEPTDQEKRRRAQIAEILATCKSPDDIERIKRMLGEVA